MIDEVEPRRGEPSHARVNATQEARAKLEQVFRKKLDPAIFSNSSVIDDANSAAGFVRNLVRAGALKIGDTVPADALARAIGLHRNTMSKALNFLANEGYLHRRQGRPAKVVSNRALPDRQSSMISHTEVAQQHHVEISSEVTRIERCRLSGVHQARRSRVALHLELEPTAKVIVLSRIRMIRGESTAWTPAIAETAYFAAKRIGAFVYDDLHSGRIESLSEYLKTNGIVVVSSEYRIRISGLPDPFLVPWAKCAAISEEQVKWLRFLRFESTTHSPQGPVEYSIAYLKEGLFAISTTNPTVEIRTEDLAREAGLSATVTSLPAERKREPHSRPANATESTLLCNPGTDRATTERAWLRSQGAASPGARKP